MGKRGAGRERGEGERKKNQGMLQLGGGGRGADAVHKRTPKLLPTPGLRVKQLQNYSMLLSLFWIPLAPSEAPVKFRLP